MPLLPTTMKFLQSKNFKLKKRHGESVEKILSTDHIFLHAGITDEFNSQPYLPVVCVSISVRFSRIALAFVISFQAFA